MKFSKQYLNELSLKTNFIKDNFELDNAKEIVIGYLKKLFTVNESEKEFIELFIQKIYKPELLFDNEISENIIDHPMAKWRCK